MILSINLRVTIIKLYKGNISIVGRKSRKSLYSMKKSSFESGRIFSKKYVENFIKVASKNSESSIIISI